MLGKGEAAIHTSPRHMDYFRFEGGALAGAGVVVIAAGGGSGASAFFTESGSLSLLATSWVACQSCVSVRMPLKLGIPVSRIPLAAFQ